MAPLVWRDRLVKIEDGMLMLSAKGRHDDFDFFPDQTNLKTQAVALQPGVGAVLAAQPIDELRLSILAMDDTYVLFGDDFNSAYVIAEDNMTTECDASVEVKP